VAFSPATALRRPGGFLDHAPPATAPIPPADGAAGMEHGRRAFRVPCLLVSVFAGRRGSHGHRDSRYGAGRGWF
jgi:hypothetical protein